jgi:murein DD-endopeptidase MepM/ murein hydrolase activator NlpD
MKMILPVLFLWNCLFSEGPMEAPVTQARFNALLFQNQTLASRVPCIIPIDQFSYTRISSLFAMRRHPVLSKIRHHNGLDIACEKQPILAAGTGVVSRTGYDKGLGNYIKIVHGNGYETTYGHLSQILPAKGQVVVLGEKIGVAGKTGLATGVHLHYEVRFNGRLVDPLDYLLLLYNALKKEL